MDPIKKIPQPRPFVTFDIESKEDDTQTGGFSRPFLVGMYDGHEYRAFRNDPSVARLPWHDRAIAPGGCIDKFMKYLLGEKEGGRYLPIYRDHDVYAHNMGGFDGLFMPSWLQRHRARWSFKLTPVQSRIMSMEIWRHVGGRLRSTSRQRRDGDKKDRKLSGFIRILDSFKVMPISLDRVIKMFRLNVDENGKEGGEVKGKFEMNLNADETDPRWELYNADDCQKLYAAMARYQALIIAMGGDVGVTAPATAMKLLRMKYLGGEIRVMRNIHFPDCPFDSEEYQPRPEEVLCEGCAHEFFRSAYCGGRTEIYRESGRNLTYYDINSSYPASMKEPQPIGQMRVLGENEDFSHLATNKHVGVVRATVSIPDDCYLPPLPVPMDGKLKFPTGIFSGTWDWTELSQVFKIGGKILHVEKSVWIEAARFMVPFVDDLYSMRNKKAPDYDEGRSETAKIMLNATFGKYGMEQDRLEIVILKPGENIPQSTRNPRESKKSWKKRIEREREENRNSGTAKQMHEIEAAPSALFEHASTVRYRNIRVDAAYIIPQIAMHITATARVRLWMFDMEITRRGGIIVYGDTDSVLTNLDDLPTSDDLGKAKKEWNGDKLDIICHAPKMYTLKKSDKTGSPFAGEHEKDKEKTHVCQGCAPPYLTDIHDKKCSGKCGGCSRVKIMMKGVPRNMKTEQTIESLLAGSEIFFRQHEKLGALARRDLRDTPMMIDVKKSMKSKYDKRILLPSGNTRAIVVGKDVDAEAYLSETWIGLPRDYEAPMWLTEIGQD
jgi:hypothetical protein